MTSSMHLKSSSVRVTYHRRCVLFEVLAPLGAGDGHDVLALVQEPGERELAGGYALLVCHLPHAIYELQVFSKFSPWKLGEERL